MRFSHQCDSMNLTGCTEFHEWEASRAGIQHLIVSHQIECGIVLGVVLVLAVAYFISRKIKKCVISEDSE